MSASRRIVTICSSVNRVFFMAPSLSEGAILSSVSWSENGQAGQVATNALPRTDGHPFYQRLNQVLDQHGFDAFVEAQCATFYAPIGRPSLLPGTYFRLLLIGYFEGLDSERGIAWRTADSLALRGFLAGC